MPHASSTPQHVPESPMIFSESHAEDFQVHHSSPGAPQHLASPSPSPHQINHTTRFHQKKISSWCTVNDSQAPRYATLLYSAGDSIASSSRQQHNASPGGKALFSSPQAPRCAPSSPAAQTLPTSSHTGDQIMIQKSFFSKTPWFSFKVAQINSLHKLEHRPSSLKAAAAESTNSPSHLDSRTPHSKTQYTLHFQLDTSPFDIHFNSRRRRDEWFDTINRIRIKTIQDTLTEQTKLLMQIFSSSHTDQEEAHPSPHVQNCLSALQHSLQEAHASLPSHEQQDEFLSALPAAFNRTLYHHKESMVDEESETDEPPTTTTDTSLQRSTAAWKIDYSELKIKQKLSEGSFGVVYKGTLYEKDVAIKKLKLRDNVLNNQLVEELKKEAEILASLRHPNVLLFLGITDPPEMCLVTEFLEQGNIYNVLRKNILNDIQLHSILMDICYGVLFIHKQKILHSDLKPANILMSKNGIVAKVADFGISRMLQNENDKIVDATQEGTLLYKSPELAFQFVMSIAADAFSFGVVLYEILYLKEHPSVLMHSNGFEDDRISVMAFDLVREDYNGEKPPHCPPWWLGAYRRLIRDCLKQDPDKRISFEDIITRLTEIKEQQQTNPWFIFDNTANELHNLTKHFSRLKRLHPEYRIMEVIQYCLSEFRAPRIHYYSLCSLIHMSCIHLENQQQHLHRAIQALYEISTHSKLFFEKKGHFVYWNLLLDSKCLSTADKERVLKHAIELCKNDKILRRFVHQGALGMVAYKLDPLRNKPATPLPFFPDDSSDFDPAEYFHGDYFAPALFPEATRLLSMMCKDPTITEKQLHEENVIPALVSLSSQGLDDRMVNGVAYTALETLAHLLTRYPSLSDSCYNLHINPKLIASREYLGTIMKFEKIVSQDKKAMKQLKQNNLSPAGRNRRNAAFGRNTLGVERSSSGSATINATSSTPTAPQSPVPKAGTPSPSRSATPQKRLSLQNNTSPIPTATLNALRSHLSRQRSNRFSLSSVKDKSHTQLSKLLEEKHNSLQLLNTPDISRQIEPRERENLIIKFWERIKELDLNNISTSDMEKNLIHSFKKENLEKQKNGIRFIKGLVQQIDDPNEIIENHLYLGSEWNAASQDVLHRLGIHVVLNVSPRAPCYFPNEFEYHRMQETEHMLTSFQEACKIIDACIKEGKRILIHSTLGTNRSPTFCIAYLMKSRGWSLRKAYKYVQEKRDIINIQRKYMKELMMWYSKTEAHKKE